MRRIMILNWNGGCGKSTIATHLAGCCAVNGYHTARIDHDPQGTSIRWLKLRNGDRPIIHGMNASQVTRSFQMRGHPAPNAWLSIRRPACAAMTCRS